MAARRSTKRKRVARKRPARLEVGDRVSFVFGVERVIGVIVEDRGGLGVGGKRVLRVRMKLDPWNTHEFEMPEDEFRAA
jgi:hypothetical protein